jgi:hypothetical protein
MEIKIKDITELDVQAIQALSIWEAASVSEVPNVELSRWQVAQLPNGNRHFIGCNLTEGREGRVSSRIVRFDAPARAGVTESGRVYRLFGRPGRYAEAANVWKKWLRINGHDPAECVDVSAEVEAAIAAAVPRAS